MTASDAEPAFSRSAELRTIWRIAMPAAVMVAFKNACLVTDQAMLGHLLDASGKPTDLYLDAAALALLLINLSYSAFMRGIAGATNTLTSQALGAGNRRLVGTWLLVGCLFALGGALCCGLFWLCTPSILAAVVRTGAVTPPGSSDPARATELAGRFALISAGWLVPSMLTDVGSQWLIAQRVVAPQSLVYIGSFFANLGLNYVLVFGVGGVGGVGFDGSPIATTATRILGLLLLAALVCRNRALAFPPRNSWADACSARRLCTFARQAAPGLLGAALEEAQLEFVGFLAARLGSTSMSAHSSMLLSFFFLTSPM